MISGTLLLELLIVGTILTAVLILFVVLVVRRMHERRRQLAEDLATDKEIRKDRAYNALRLASAEAAVLERDGIDTASARTLIAQGEAAIKAGEDFHALALGRTAQDTLIRLRQEAIPARLAAPTAPEPEPPLPEESSEPAAVPATGKNPAAARFQIRLLTEEIATAQKNEPTRSGLSEAIRFQSRAIEALEEEEVTAALGLALKGRRAIGARIESLPPSAPLSPAPPPATRILERSPTGPVAAPDAPPGSVPCPKCGRPSKGSDLFCRNCGAPIGTARCPRCQAPLEPDDRFCSRCGASSGG